MNWLVAGGKPGDSFFLHYSGHGSKTEDLDGDAEDGLNEGVLPVDFKTAGQIVDDVWFPVEMLSNFQEMHDIIVKPLPKGARLTAIFDCFQSGSVLDLPYQYVSPDPFYKPNNKSVSGSQTETNLVRETAKSLYDAGISYALGDINAIVRAGCQLFKRVFKGIEAKEKLLRVKSSEADVVEFSSLQDYEMAGDTIAAGPTTGAMSWAFRQVLTEQPNQSYEQLLRNLREVLARPPLHQKPVLSSSRPFDITAPFVLVTE